jgi:hypothetical protein
MRAKLKHIILACSNAGKLAVQQELLGDMPSSIHITVAVTSKELEAMICQHVPDLIIVLRLGNEDDNKDNFLQAIRKNDSHDEIPVFVYTITPGKKYLSDLLKK